MHGTEYYEDAIARDPTLFLLPAQWRKTMRAMKWILRILSILIILIVLSFVIGFALPANTKHTRTITLQQTPDAIFAVLADVQKFPEWNRNMQKIEMLPPTGGKETTRQTFKGNMVMTIVTSESDPPKYLVRSMGDVGGPFVGNWTYEISPAADGSDVVLKEHSEIKNPFFRVMVYIFGPTKYMDEHLVDLAKRLGETATVR